MVLILILLRGVLHISVKIPYFQELIITDKCMYRITKKSCCIHYLWYQVCKRHNICHINKYNILIRVHDMSQRCYVKLRLYFKRKCQIIICHKKLHIKIDFVKLNIKSFYKKIVLQIEWLKTVCDNNFLLVQQYSLLCISILKACLSICLSNKNKWFLWCIDTLAFPIVWCLWRGNC